MSREPYRTEGLDQNSLVSTTWRMDNDDVRCTVFPQANLSYQDYIRHVVAHLNCVAASFAIPRRTALADLNEVMLGQTMQKRT